MAQGLPYATCRSAYQQHACACAGARQTSIRVNAGNDNKNQERQAHNRDIVFVYGLLQGLVMLVGSVAGVAIRCRIDDVTQQRAHAVQAAKNGRELQDETTC